ncbi:CHASE3 domain-containing protein [Brevundimonas fluminis]|jgi:PAS domain S-box-containing protein|uniref:CHASE3 domain-containing protein n=1 Tax=Brevundimonas fluminis TaxID=2487274 RepID=UPI0013DDD0CE|nr:CHASE3 domain-containing protein [Brevundimonas fluminis]
MAAGKSSLRSTRYRWGLAVAGGLVLAILVASAVELRREFGGAARLRAEVGRSYDTRSRIQSVFSLMQDAETGQRGFIITGDERFLEPYDRALREMDGALAELQRRLADDPAQSREVVALRTLVGRKRDTMERTVELRTDGDVGAAMAIVSSGEGKIAMDGIREVVERMIRQEAAALDQLAQRSEGRTRRTEALVAALFVLLIATAAIIGFLVWRFVTTRTALMERLAASAARQQATLDSAIDAIVTLNPSGSVESVNAAGERMFGWPASDLIRRDVGVLIDLADNGEGAFLRRLGESQGALEGGIVREMTARRRDGSTFPVDVALGAMDLPTGRHLVAVVRDISERRRIEAMKDAFVSTVSHELRTPLTSIAGSLGLLAGGAAGELPEKASRLIGIAHSNSQRLVRLINDILDVEKLESGRQPMTMEVLDLRDVARRSVEGVQGYADQLGVVLSLGEGEPAPVRGDMDRLIQVVTNLLSNAAKFSPSGGEVSVGVNPETRIARLSVADRGPGIPDAFRARIFGKFAQADASDARAKGGTGLGLAIAREIAERHGGRLWFESQEGEGATFHLDLPLWSDAPRSTGAGRLLICEDDPDAARVLSDMLALEGYETDVAATAREALSLARRGAYQAALVDLQLPDADGVGLIRALKADRSTRGMPVIVVSGDVARGKVRGRSLEVVDWMEKPFDQDRLRQAIAALPGAARPKVLHVDDDPDILSVTAEALGDTAEVTPARSLGEARDALGRQRPDLVILDLGLPDGHGLDLLPDLTDEAGATIPVIVYSAQDLDARIAPSVQAVLTKSRMSLTQLSRTVHRLATNREGEG